MAKRAQIDEARPILDAVNKELDAVEGFLDSIEGGADKATDILEAGIEKVADVVPDVLDKGVHMAAEGTRTVARQFRSPRTMLITVSVTGVVVGAGLGVGAYFLLKKRMESKLIKAYETKLDAEINGMRLFYEKRSKAGKYATPEAAAEELLPKTREEHLAENAVEALEAYEGDQPPPGIISPEDDPRAGANSRVRYDKIPPRSAAPLRVAPTAEEPEEITQNVFTQQASLGDWDQEAEEASRNPESPYVISHDEFLENSYEHGQNTITYYAGDEILADEREQMIDEVEAIVGMQNLQLFGHGSRDSNVVYVRNERIEVDFEVTLNQGKFSEEVMGFQHADLPASRFRHGRKGDDG